MEPDSRLNYSERVMHYRAKELNWHNKYHTVESRAFTLTEVMITIGIVGILSSIALPNYFRQIQRTHQAEANSTVSQVLATVAAYVDEFGTQPEQWVDLNSITYLMTDEGPVNADNGTLTASINLPGNRYQLMQKETSGGNNGYYIFEALSINPKSADFNVLACVDLTNGASHQISGKYGSAAEISSLKCG